MCGIIVYYGGAENSINRVLAGMWAIVYRAPDSTGIGVAGSELEPLKIRKELGSVTRLIDRLIVSPVFDEAELRAVSMMDDDFDNHADVFIQNQKKLLLFEGFSPNDPLDLKWSDLIDIEKNLEIAPGTAGNPEIQAHFNIDTPKKFIRVIDRLSKDYDLPLVLIERLLKQGFEYQIELLSKASALPVHRNDLVSEFLQIFDYYIYDEHPERPERTACRSDQKNPYSRKYVWKCLKNMTVTLPSDYSNDAIVNLFRRIDSAVLAGSSQNPKINDRIQQIFESLWAKHKSGIPVQWRNLYHTERVFNVYGLAAAAALICFQTDLYIRQFPDGPEKVYPQFSHAPGTTNPLLLQSMTQPVIAQGRWAIQSSISVRNAHPFLDEKKLRAVVLNGQFSSDTESRVQAYLTSVEGLRLRSENSTELFSLLWGYTFDTISTVRKRYQEIDKQYRLGLEDISVYSQSLDLGIFKKLKDKTRPQLDQMSFIRAMEVMIQAGGQFAICGISLVSKDRLFVGAHKRPVYIVRCRDTSDFMVVSDINAAIGLFSQSLIRRTSIKLRKLMKEYSKKSLIVEPHFFDGRSESSDYWFRKEKMALLKPFQVEITSLDQERIFAKIQTRPGHAGTLRQLELTDFSGKKRNDIFPEITHLTPITFKKDFGRTYYEEHLFEIPGLLTELLRRYTDNKVPVFEIKSRLLARRFGRTLSSLSRIILVSTGFSYEIARIVEKNMERFFSGINIVVTTPLDIDNIESSINPDRNLVVMVSWSGTTADMIDFADRLIQRDILMVGITEKPFSDLGLIARKSAGVIPVFSGEEATVAPLKSAICMMLLLELFCLYLENMVSHDTAPTIQLVSEMDKIPKKIDAMLKDDKILRFCKEVSKAVSRSSCHYIIDALHASGSGKFASLNLELNAWNSVGTAIDYSEKTAFIKTLVPRTDFICVNVTNNSQLSQGIDFMKALKTTGIPFYAATCKNEDLNKVTEWAEQTVVLPKVSDHFQPFIDITFMALFGFYFGLARGRLADEMPRNLAKSVTAGRVKDRSTRTVTAMMDELHDKNRALSRFSAITDTEKLLWVQQSRGDQERQHYKDLLVLSAVFHSPDPFSEFFRKTADDSIKEISNQIFDFLADDGIIIFVPMDKHAEAGCMNFLGLWNPLLDLPLQMEYPEKIKWASIEDSLVIVVASMPSDPDLVKEVATHSHSNKIWIGAEMDLESQGWLGVYYLKESHPATPTEHIFFALSQFFTTVMGTHFPNRSETIGIHFKLFLPTIQKILADQKLRQTVQQAVMENRTYKKILFISGFKGGCTSWEYKFKYHLKRSLKSETFGTSTYSHLVLVDPRFDAKYVQLESRDRMIKAYSKEMLNAWEDKYLGGISADEFLGNYSMPLHSDATLPFMVDDQWYLPVLQPDYDTDQDCLVIVDATSESLFDAVLDELATFGSRYARIVVITQSGFRHDTRLTNLKKYPLSHMIIIPELDDHDGNPITISDFILPVVVDIIGSAMKFIDQSIG